MTFLEGRLQPYLDYVDCFSYSLVGVAGRDDGGGVTRLISG